MEDEVRVIFGWVEESERCFFLGLCRAFKNAACAEFSSISSIPGSKSEFAEPWPEPWPEPEPAPAPVLVSGFLSKDTDSGSVSESWANTLLYELGFTVYVSLGLWLFRGRDNRPRPQFSL